MSSYLNLIKRIWRMYNRYKYKKHNIYLHNTCIFNDKTEFSGFNKFQEGAKISNAKIGKYTYVGKNSNIINCQVGNFCSIGANLKVSILTHPSRVYVSTSPVFFSTKNQCGTHFVPRDIFDEHKLCSNGFYVTIGNDVWIGDDVTIIGGVTIGDGAIIALGSIVTKDVPPFAVVGGIPAKVIRYRFDDDMISLLNKVEWWNKDDEWFKEHYKLFENIDYFKKEFINYL